MAVAKVQSRSSSGTAASNTLAFTSNVTSGNVLVASFEIKQQTLPSAVTDSQGNTWTLITSKSNGTNQKGFMTIGAYWAEAGSTGADTVTFPGTASTAIAYQIAEYSGVNTTQAIDMAAGTGSGGTTLSTTTTVTTGATWQTNEMVVAAWGHPNTGGTITQPTGYTAEETSAATTPEYSLADKVLTTTGTQSAAFSTTATSGTEAALIFCLQGSGVPVPVQYKTNINTGTSATTATCVFPSAVTVGDLIVCTTGDGGVAISSIADNLGNTYTESATGGGRRHIFHAPVTTGGSCTVTVTFASSIITALQGAEYAGLATTSPVDTSGAVAGGAATTSVSLATSGTVSTANSVVFASVGHFVTTQASAPTAGTGYHNILGTTGEGVEDELQDTSGSVATAAWTLSTSSVYDAIVVVYKPAGTGPTTYIVSTTENVAHASGWNDGVSSIEAYFRATSEPSSAGDAVAAVRTLPRAPSAEAVSFASGWDASVGRLVTAKRTPSENVAVAQGWDVSPARTVLFFRAPGAETVAVAQGWDASAVSARTFTRTILENVAVAQGWDASVARAALSLLRPASTELIAHAQGWDDLLARLASFFRGQNEASLAGDAVAAGRSYTRSVVESIAHAHGWEDAIARRLLAVRAVTEAVAHAAGWDDAGPSVTRTQFLAMTEAIAHAQAWDDAIITRAYFFRGQTEGGFPADVVSRVVLALRARTENVSAGSGWDASAAFRGTYFRSVVEAVSHAQGWEDTAIGARTFLRAITENVGAAQTWDASVARRLSAIRAAIENVAFASGLDATPIAHMLFLRAVSEPSFSADSAVGFKAFFRSVPSEAIAFAAGWDALASRITMLTRSPASETAFFGDSVSRRVTAIRSALEAIASAQGWDASVVGAKTFARAISESVSFASGWDASAARLLLARRVATETGSPSDLAAFRLILSRAVVENIAASQGWDASAVGFRGFARSTIENVAAAQAWDASVARSLLALRAAAETSLVGDTLSVHQFLARQAVETVGSARGWEAAAAASLLRVLSVPSEPSLSADTVGLALLRIRTIVESSASNDATSVRLLLFRSLLEAIAASRGWDAIANVLFIPSHQPFIVPVGRVIRGEDGTLLVTGEPSPLHVRSDVEWPFVVTGESSPLDVRSGYAETLREDI